jgi:hypothetical protein
VPNIFAVVKKALPVPRSRLSKPAANCTTVSNKNPNKPMKREGKQRKNERSAMKTNHEMNLTFEKMTKSAAFSRLGKRLMCRCQKCGMFP